MENLGMHFVVGISGTSLTAEEKKLIPQVNPSGIILFAENITDKSSWPKELRQLIAEIRSLSKREHLLVSIDHEGGRVHRLQAPITHFPAALEWREKAFDVAGTMAQELFSLSINTSYAPVLDINLEEKNEVIGNRAFSDNPNEVSEYATECYRGLENAGVLACGKHFPGHGATIEDSHFELPVLDVSRETILERELLPYRRLIQEGLQLIMTAHVVYPQLDPDNPATFSKKIINELLRKELGYQHVVISDDLEMKAVTDLSTKDRAIKSLLAGVDLLLVGKSADKSPLALAKEMLDGIEEEITAGTLDKEAIAESRKRIESLLKYSAHLHKKAQAY